MSPSIFGDLSLVHVMSHCLCFLALTKPVFGLMEWDREWRMLNAFFEGQMFFLALSHTHLLSSAMLSKSLVSLQFTESVTRQLEVINFYSSSESSNTVHWLTFTFFFFFYDTHKLSLLLHFGWNFNCFHISTLPLTVQLLSPLLGLVHLLWSAHHPAHKSTACRD